MPKSTRTITAIPPTTPPTIAPTFESLLTTVTVTVADAPWEFDETVPEEPDCPGTVVDDVEVKEVTLWNVWDSVADGFDDNDDDDVEVEADVSVDVDVAGTDELETDGGDWEAEVTVDSIVNWGE
jgi:hypothetical protein